jgi:poly(beta-D-mannuronate) lyase
MADDTPLAVAGVSASADDGNVPANTLDSSLATRWAAAGDGQWIRYDLGTAKKVGALKIAWHQGNQRTARFEVQTGDNGTDWNTVFSGASSGTTTSLESYDVADSVRRYVRIVGHGNSQSLWNSITEVEIHDTVGVTLPAPGRELAIATAKLANGQQVTLRWTNAASTAAQVQGSPDLRTWMNLGAAVTNAGAQTWQETVSAAGGAARYYRLQKTRIVAADAPPTKGKVPGQVLNLANWKLTLPVDTVRAGTPDEVKQPELDSFEDANYFHMNSTLDGVVFKAHCGGDTTSGSSYPRSELREMTNNGSAKASWATTEGTHTMEIVQAVTHLPVVKPDIVVGQIHDAADDVCVFRLDGTTLRINPHGVHGPVLTSNYQLGTKFTVKFVARDGGVEFYYNGQYIYTYKVSTSGCYFKAGAYTQSNTSRGDAATAYGEVVIYKVTVTHE